MRNTTEDNKTMVFFLDIFMLILTIVSSTMVIYDVYSLFKLYIIQIIFILIIDK